MKWRHGSYAPVKKQNKPHSTSSKIAGKTAGISTKQLENKIGPDKNQVELSREGERERALLYRSLHECVWFGFVIPWQSDQTGQRNVGQLEILESLHI